VQFRWHPLLRRTQENSLPHRFTCVKSHFVSCDLSPSATSPLVRHKSLVYRTFSRLSNPESFRFSFDDEDSLLNSRCLAVETVPILLGFGLSVKLVTANVAAKTSHSLLATCKFDDPPFADRTCHYALCATICQNCKPEKFALL
jgi:hypothetical protein